MNWGFFMFWTNEFLYFRVKRFFHVWRFLVWRICWRSFFFLMLWWCVVHLKLLDFSPFPEYVMEWGGETKSLTDQLCQKKQKKWEVISWPRDGNLLEPVRVVWDLNTRSCCCEGSGETLQMNVTNDKVSQQLYSPPEASFSEMSQTWALAR